MNLLNILNDVLAQSSYLQKAEFANSTDVDDVQMMAIANRVAYEIMNYYNWSSLRKATEILMAETVEISIPEGVISRTPITVYGLPSDFQSLIPDSAWESEGSRIVELPTPEDRWYMYKFSAYSDGGTLRARIIGKSPTAEGDNIGRVYLEVHDPQPGETFEFEYISKGVVIPEDTAEDARDRFEKDTDSWLLDDQLLVLGIQANWAQTTLLPQANDWKANYDSKMAEAISRDSSGRTIGGQGHDWIGRRSPYYPLYRSG